MAEVDKVANIIIKWSEMGKPNLIEGIAKRLNYLTTVTDTLTRKFKGFKVTEVGVLKALANAAADTEIAMAKFAKPSQHKFATAFFDNLTTQLGKLGVTAKAVKRVMPDLIDSLFKIKPFTPAMVKALHARGIKVADVLANITPVAPSERTKRFTSDMLEIFRTLGHESDELEWRLENLTKPIAEGGDTGWGETRVAVTAEEYQKLVDAMSKIKWETDISPEFDPETIKDARLRLAEIISEKEGIPVPFTLKGVEDAAKRADEQIRQFTEGVLPYSGRIYTEADKVSTFWKQLARVLSGLRIDFDKVGYDGTRAVTGLWAAVKDFDPLLFLKPTRAVSELVAEEFRNLRRTALESYVPQEKAAAKVIEPLKEVEETVGSVSDAIEKAISRKGLGSPLAGLVGKDAIDALKDIELEEYIGEFPAAVRFKTDPADLLRRFEDLNLGKLGDIPKSEIPLSKLNRADVDSIRSYLDLFADKPFILPPDVLTSVTSFLDIIGQLRSEFDDPPPATEFYRSILSALPDLKIQAKGAEEVVATLRDYLHDDFRKSHKITRDEWDKAFTELGGTTKKGYQDIDKELIRSGENIIRSISTIARAADEYGDIAPPEMLTEAGKVWKEAEKEEARFGETVAEARERVAKRDMKWLREKTLTLYEGVRATKAGTDAINGMVYAIQNSKEALTDEQAQMGLAATEAFGRMETEMKLKKAFEKFGTVQKKGELLTNAAVESTIKSSIAKNQAIKVTDKLIKSIYGAEEALSEEDEALVKTIVDLVGASDGMAMFEKRLKKHEADLGKVGKETKKWYKNIKGLGMRWSWFGYRLASMGRMIIKWVTKPISDLVNLMSNLDKTMTSAAMGLIDAGMSSEEAGELFGDFALNGIELQKAMGGIYLALMRIAVDVGPTIIRFIKDLSARFQTIWAEQGPQLTAALGNLVNSFLGLLDAVTPLIPQIAFLAAAITPLMPLLVAFGTALFFIAPLSAILGSGLGVLVSYFAAVGSILPWVIAKLAAYSAVSVMTTLANLKSALATGLATGAFATQIATIGFLILMLGSLYKRYAQYNKKMRDSMTAVSRNISQVSKAVTKDIVSTTTDMTYAFDEQGNLIDTATDDVVGWLRVLEDGSKTWVDANGDIMFSLDELGTTLTDANDDVVTSFSGLKTTFMTTTGEIVGQLTKTATGWEGWIKGVGAVTVEGGAIIDTASKDVVGALVTMDDGFGGTTDKISLFDGALLDIVDTEDTVSTSLGDMVTSVEGLGTSFDTFGDDFTGIMDDMVKHMIAMTAISIGAKFGLEGLAAGLLVAGAVEIGWPWLKDTTAKLGDLIGLIPDVDTAAGAITSGPWDALQNIIDWFNELTVAIDDTIDSLETLEDQVDAEFGTSIGTTIVKDMTPAVEVLTTFNDEMSQLSKISPIPKVGDVGALTSPIGAEALPGTQHVTMYNEITITTGPISGDVDLDALVNAVTEGLDRGIGEKLRRRLYPRW